MAQAQSAQQRAILEAKAGLGFGRKIGGQHFHGVGTGQNHGTGFEGSVGELLHGHGPAQAFLEALPEAGGDVAGIGLRGGE